MRSTRDAWSGVRCLFESPILDEHKWGKVPYIPADAFILDLEDSVPLSRKEEAREKVVTYLKEPQYFNGALTVPRVNHLSTEWGREDLVTLARAGAEVIMYPKTSSVDDVREVTDIMASEGIDVGIVVTIESAQGVVEVERILAMPQVVAASFGAGDLHVDARIPLYDVQGRSNSALLYPKMRVVLAGAANGVPTLGIAYVPDIRDVDEVRRRVTEERLLGFTGVAAFYPPHVEIINEVFSASREEIDRARHVVEIYEAAVQEGKPAVQLASGEAILVHQYKEAQEILVRSAKSV